MEILLRINGRAPAWPQMLEQDHPFYRNDNAASFGSASYSLMGNSGTNKTPEWEILIDAGHNTVPFLIQNGNRIPNAVFLTHGHPDHILGVDWIAQSLRFGNDHEKKLPVYCTAGVWDMLMVSYRHIRAIVEHICLEPGKTISVTEAEGLQVTPFPVFHGKGAAGASMLLFGDSHQVGSPGILFTGDMLCPLLRKKDYESLARAGLLFIDCNNRFPYPQSNHISFIPEEPGSLEFSRYLSDWFVGTNLSDLLSPHQHHTQSTALKEYEEEFLSDWSAVKEIPHTIIDFVRLTQIPRVYLMHYFGLYDSELYNEPLLSPGELSTWAQKEAEGKGLKCVNFAVPEVGELIRVGEA